MDSLRFWAFWEGLWIDSRQLKRTLNRYLRSTLPAVRHSEDPVDHVEALAFSPLVADLAPKFGFRRTDHAQSAIFALLLGALGGDPGWDFEPIPETTRVLENEPTPRRLAERMLGLTSLTEPIGEFGSIVDSPPDPRHVLSQIAETGLGDPTLWPRMIRNTQMVDLRRGTDTARVLVEDLALWADAARQVGLNLPSTLTRITTAPPNRGASAIRARVRMIPIGIAINRLPFANTVEANLAAIREAASSIRQAMR